MTHAFDLKNNLAGGVSFKPAAMATASSPQTGSAVDLGVAVGPISALLSGGTFTSPGTVDVKLQEAIEDPDNLGSALASDWSDITGATFTQVSASNPHEWILVKNATKRFVRAYITTAGGSASLIAGVWIFAQKRNVGASAAGYSTSPQS